MHRRTGLLSRDEYIVTQYSSSSLFSREWYLEYGLIGLEKPVEAMTELEWGHTRLPVAVATTLRCGFRSHW